MTRLSLFKKETATPLTGCELDSATITFMRFPLAAAVVAIHAACQFGEIKLGEMQATPWEPMHLYRWFQILFSFVFPRVAVPSFFLISGYLFFLHWHEWDWTRYKQKLRKRVHTLLIPYLAFIAFYTFFLLVGIYMDYDDKDKAWAMIARWWEKRDYWHILWDSSKWEFGRRGWFDYSYPMTGPMLVPLWFVRDLMVLAVCSPLVFALMRYTRGIALTLLAFAYLSTTWFVSSGPDINSIFFFSLGATCGIWNCSPVQMFKKAEWPCYALALVLALPLMWYYDQHTRTGCRLNPVFITAAMGATFCLASRLVQNGYRIAPLLVESTFFVYAAHQVFILQYTKRVVDKLIPCADAWAFTLRYLITIPATVCACVVLYMLFKALMPRALAFFTGGR